MPKQLNIKLSVPPKNEKWKTFFSLSKKTSRVRRTTAALSYAMIETRVNNFYKANPKGTTALTIDYGVEHPLEANSWKNEGTYSESRLTLYTLACFLEDYLPVVYQQKKFKQYLPL